MRSAFLSIVLLFAAAACKEDNPAADNTAKNTRATKTADEAPQTGGALELTAKIRKALVGADDLSMNAKNVKVVVDGTAVTLVGPVASAEEKTRVESLAKAAGASQVVNQLEITN